MKEIEPKLNFYAIRLHFHADSKSVQLLQRPCSESSYSGHLANAFRVVIAPIDKVVEILSPCLSKHLY